jgi:hypothetical protein
VEDLLERLIQIKGIDGQRKKLAMTRFVSRK